MALGDTPKRERRQIAKSEVWMHLATTAQAWADQVADKSDTIPFAEWPADDPHVTLCRVYGLSPADLARTITDVAQEAENHALRAGFDRHWT